MNYSLLVHVFSSYGIRVRVTKSGDPIDHDYIVILIDLTA